MRYRYDPAKKAANLKKHGLDFDDARSVIESAQTVTSKSGDTHEPDR